jgi:glycosyltransferase involved in cell wall biosynthesis
MLDVDVIIPFHRDIDSYLLEAISSVEQSVGVNPRIILINDRPSNTNATQFLKQKGYEVLTSNGGGYSECLNLGVQNSSSQYVAQLNSDDLHDPKRLIKQIKLMSDSNLDVSIARLKKFGNKKKHFELSGKQPSFFYDKTLLFLGAYGANASAVFHRKFLANKLWESVDMCDWKFAFDNYPNKIAYVDEQLYLYRMHPKQISRIMTQTPDWLKKCWRDKFTEYLDKELVISQELIEAIALPGKLPILSHEDFFTMIEIFDSLNNKNSNQNRQYQKDFRSLLVRRLVIAIAKNRKGAKISKFAKLFGGRNIAAEMCKMSAEIARYSRQARF